MKKLFLAVLVFLTNGLVQALPVGNPADPSLYDPQGLATNWYNCISPWELESFAWRIGFYGDYVFDRHLKAGTNLNQVTANATGAGDIRRTRIVTNSGVINLNILDQFDIFGTFGTTRISILTEATALGLNNTSQFAYVDFGTEMSYSVGGRAIVWQHNGFYVGFEGQYFSTSPKWLSTTGQELGFPSFLNHSNRSGYKEWQAACAASYVFCNSANFCMSPYTALTFSGVDWGFAHVLRVRDISFASPDIEQQKTLGWLIGMTLLMNDLVGVSAEAHFANEKALSVIGQISF